MKRIYRSVRRTVGAGLRRLGLRRPEEPAHKPEFDARALARRLGVAESALAGDAHEGSLAYAGARRARELFGPRFFVDLDRIAELSAAFAAEHPDIVSRLDALADHDVDGGLAVYTVTTTRLGAQYNWSSPPVGLAEDLLYPVRPHRFAFAPRHAWACLRRPALTSHLQGMLASWIAYAESGDCQYCYVSNLVVLQRVFATMWAWAFLASRPQDASTEGLGLEWLLLQVLYADARFLATRLGDSVPNNHLLADRFAHWFLATVLPELLDPTPADLERAWCDELLAQTYADGGGFEHSAHYHEFACEMSAAYLLLCARNGRLSDVRVRERTRALLAYQCALGGTAARPLAIGNAVEDALFPLDAGEGWCPGSLREIYRSLFDAELPPTPNDDDTRFRAFWLLNGRLAPASAGDRLGFLPEHFPQAGLHVLAEPSGRGRLLFRTGPAADTRVYAGHMHADLLAIYLDTPNSPVLVDAGTYSYRGTERLWQGEPCNWHRYFVGPEAHNVLTLAGGDPLGVAVGDFRPAESPVHVHTLQLSDGVLSLIDARLYSDNVYDGCARVVVHVADAFWLLLDTPPHDRQDIAAAWYGFQCDRGLDVHTADGGVCITKSDDALDVWIAHSDAVHSPQIFCGATEPVAGWVSPRYGERVAAPQLRFDVPADAMAAAFLVSLHADYAQARIVRHLQQNDGAHLVVLETRDGEEWLVYQPVKCKAWQLHDATLSFDGVLLWMRFGSSGLAELRWLGGTALSLPAYAVDIVLRGDKPADLAIGPQTTADEIAPSCARLQWPFCHRRD